MWVLTEVIRARQAAARIGRFDVSPTTLLTGTPALPHGSGALPEGLLPAGWGWSIPAMLCSDSRSLSQVDGCYDVNLLSYT